MKDLSTKKHFVGCDVSKATLDFALYERGKDYRTFAHIQVNNSLEGFQAMRKWLRSHHHQNPPPAPEREETRGVRPHGLHRAVQNVGRQGRTPPCQEADRGTQQAGEGYRKTDSRHRGLG